MMTEILIRLLLDLFEDAFIVDHIVLIQALHNIDFIILDSTFHFFAALTVIVLV